MSEPFVGEIRIFAGSFAPRGWAFCDGQLLAVAQNDALFSLFGTIYGGDGRTTFGLPDLRGRLPIHMGQGPGLSDRRIGQSGGAEQVTLFASQVPAHTHALNASTNIATQTSPGNNFLAQSTAMDAYVEDPPNTALDAASVGGSGQGSLQHNNIQPFLCVHFIVALVGIYPSRN
jgi:microcystin-dependent protein